MINRHGDKVEALSALRFPNGFNPLLDFGRPLAKLLLSDLLSDASAGEELGLETCAIELPIVFTQVIGEPLSRNEIAVAVST